MGASSRLRFHEYIHYLNSNGINVDLAPFFNNDYLEILYKHNKRNILYLISRYLKRLYKLISVNRYDCIWIEKEIFPWVPLLCERLIANINIPIVVDFDDAIFHRYTTHRYAFVRKFLGKKIDNIMQAATLVTVGNDYLAMRAEMAGAKRIEIIPTAVNLNKYLYQKKPCDNDFRIGWIGTPLTQKYIQIIKKPLQKLSADPKIKLSLIGTNNIKLNGIKTEIIEWKEDTEASAINSFDVGIMPLVNGEWERGKCGYKIIQYMACRLPVVASPVGFNTDIVDHGKNGFLAESDDDWVNYIKILRDDESLRKKMGNYGREKVEQKYSLNFYGNHLSIILKSICHQKT
ncbi:MAG: glycosyltransferase family 4 protein [Candidatus Anammoxibacter sp.]